MTFKLKVYADFVDMAEGTPIWRIGSLDLSGDQGIKVLNYSKTVGSLNFYKIFEELKNLDAARKDEKNFWRTETELELEVEKTVCPWVLEHILEGWGVHPVQAGYAVQRFLEAILPGGP